MSRGALRAVPLVALGLFLAACNASQPAPQPKAQATSAASALEALQAGDYQRAAELYRRAVAAEPGDVGLHFGLAVAVSYLQLKDETAREFSGRVAGLGPAAGAAFTRVTLLYERARFGGTPPSDVDVAEAEAALATLARRAR